MNELPYLLLKFAEEFNPFGMDRIIIEMILFLIVVLIVLVVLNTIVFVKMDNLKHDIERKTEGFREIYEKLVTKRGQEDF